MKITCQSEHLRKALELAGDVVPNHSTFPVLSGLRVEANGDGKAYMRATDLERMVIVDLHGSMGEPGGVTLPKASFCKFISGEKGVILIESKGKTTTLSNGDRTASITRGNIPGDFPPVSTADLHPGVWIEPYQLTDEFIQHLSRAIVYCAREESRPILTAVLVESDGTGIVNIATADGFRLYHGVTELSLPAGRWSIPSATCKLLTKVAIKGTTVKMGFAKDQVWFSVEPDIKIVSQLIPCNFPNYNSLIPKGKPDWTVKCSAPLLLSRLNQFDVPSGVTRFIPTENGMLGISAKYGSDYEKDSFECRIPAEMTGAGKIAMNKEILAEIIQPFAEVKMEITELSSPVKITGDLKGVTAVIAPVFVQW